MFIFRYYKKIYLQLFRRLSSEGMNDVVEDKLLLIEGHLRKLNNYLMHVDLQLKPAERRTVEVMQNQILCNFSTN